MFLAANWKPGHLSKMCFKDIQKVWIIERTSPDIAAILTPLDQKVKQTKLYVLAFSSF